MGRRSIISMTAINRIISASNSRKREQERIKLINSQNGTQKELPPTYSIKNFEFNINSRIAKIEFEQTQQYRTVERYVTQNYVKYPILSHWKLRTKTITKSLKLTNQELENLNNNDDNVIRNFASEIILAINNADLLPSWFLRKVNLEAYNEKIEALNKDNKSLCQDCENKINQFSKQIEVYKNDIIPLKQNLSELNDKHKKLQDKTNKVNTSKRTAVKYIFTLFIYAYWISNYRVNKMNVKDTAIRHNIENCSNLIRKKEQAIQNFDYEIKQLQNTISSSKEELRKKTQREYNELKKLQQQITPLPTTVSEDNNFVSLKSINGISYIKIIGCYIIRNTENNKCYVGQSKDVLKRLKQHFKGTIPNNVIFAEDYYSTEQGARDNLFEVKIIPCNTKDELDRTEKQLIEEYDSFKTGYNGTNGNN